MKKNLKNEIILHDDEYYYQIIRKNIKKERIKQNLTQQMLGDMTGLSREYITDIENEKRNKHFTIAVIGRIADALNIDIEKLFSEE